MNQTDIQQIVQYCQIHLKLKDAVDAEAYSYRSLPFCVIDTIYSIGARYQSTERTVKRFCDFVGLERIDPTHSPEKASQISISRFLEMYDHYGVDRMAIEVFQNRQRTSARNGILKAAAVQMVSQVLQGYQIEYLQDASRIIGDLAFEAKFLAIRGQASGISLRYFYMLVGSDDYVKPDRMVTRFIWSATGKEYTIEEMHLGIVGAAKVLNPDYPQLTPRLLDSLIWNYQRPKGRG
jgi:hypothetical protein